ncbi:hypothetical protein VZC37_15675 [Gordonia sp. LSe1-13]|uniref:Uncharacterized protein n=1 Tax=Gordonia sesuvii TaxID=3116777 RepID=A0ABU7MFH7_9ACTN|nr:hypothetical protein [Gordonia sp. LSe1-13]
MTLTWKWDPQSATYGNYGNANQWTVNAGMSSLARESTQNSNDARTEATPALDFTFHLLSGKHRKDFLNALGWKDELAKHLLAMSEESAGAVAAGNIRTGLEKLRDSDSIILLAVSDYGCRGLTGPEFSNIDTAEFGNFIKLCRLDLFSGKDKAAGGSFGLGKAVYWRFSSIQTVLFNSVLADADAVDGNTRNRLFGVNQGVAHRLDGSSYQGRGYFGIQNAQGDVASTWATDQETLDLHLQRTDPRPGTTALLVGFQDPDDPEKGARGIEGVKDMATELRAGVEESFWPLLARGRMDVSITVKENGRAVSDMEIDPEETYAELVRALRRFDAGDLDDELSEPYSVIVREVPIQVPARKSEPRHTKFTHNAQLVVTISDEQKDTLENKVCLFRKPEMIVETIDKTFENHTYHGFLLVGGAVSPTDDDPDNQLADDFLRYSEPPAHDRWIPRGGRSKTSQSSLNAHYVPPWLPNLRRIEEQINAALFDIFGAAPPTDGKPPESVFKHLRFLSGDPGKGAAGTGRTAKPTVTMTSWEVRDGQWHLTFQIKARNRSDGWRIAPALMFVGLDGRNVEVAWSSLASADAEVDDGVVVIPGKDRGRFVSATITGVSTDSLPIPAEEATVDVEVRDLSNLSREAAK